MKMFILECTEDELRANRGLMDAVVDAAQGFINGFYGSFSSALLNNPGNEEPQEIQEEEDGNNDA